MRKAPLFTGADSVPDRVLGSLWAPPPFIPRQAEEEDALIIPRRGRGDFLGIGLG